MLRGHIDVARRDLISGWAQETDAPEQPVALLVTADGSLIARVIARSFREDLKQAGFGSGRHAFSVDPGTRLLRHEPVTIAVQRETDGVHLTNSPTAIAPLQALDADTRRHLAAVLSSIGGDAAEDAREFEVRLQFLAEQVDRLSRMRADLLNDRLERQVFAFDSRWARTPAEIGQRRILSLMLQRKTRRSRALVIDAWMPRARHDAGGNVILSHLAALIRLGFEVVLVPADMGHGDATTIEALGAEVRTRPWYGSVEEVLRSAPAAFELVYLHRGTVASCYLHLARRHNPQAKIVYSVADLEHQRFARQARVQESPELVAASEQSRAVELSTAAAADLVLTHSSAEAAWLRQAGTPNSRIALVRWSVEPKPTTVPFQKRSGIVFVGSYQHSPNVDAVLWVVEAVMPLVWQHAPNVVCRLVGSDMPAAVRALARPEVDVLGEVDEVQAVFAGARVSVAPLRFGAGVKGKVIDSYAAGIPCAGTSIGCEGLDLPPLLQRWYSDNPADIARALLTLHQDRAANETTAAAAVAYVTEHFSAGRLDSDFRKSSIVSSIPQ